MDDISMNPETVRIWSRYHSISMLLGAIPYAAFQSIVPFAVVYIVSVGILIAFSWNELAAIKPFGGWANRVTAVRMILITAVMLFNRNLEPIQIAGILFITVLLDGLDGRLARNLNQQTVFGSVFDRETDAFYVCIAGALLYRRGLAPAWILVPAFLRYAYSLLLVLMKLDGKAERQTGIGPPIGIILSVTIAGAFIAVPPVSMYALAGASVLVTVSFTVSFTLLGGTTFGRAGRKSALGIQGEN